MRLISVKSKKPAWIKRTKSLPKTAKY